VTAEDWETKYREAWEKYRQERERTRELKERMGFKQERYIAREQEYRKTIEHIEKDIEVHSTRPLEVIHEHDENALLLMGIDAAAPDQQEQIEKDRKQRVKNEAHLNQKNVKVIHSVYEQLQKSIGEMQQQTSKELLKQRGSIWHTLDRKLDDIKNQLKAEHERKQEDNYDYREREKELNEHLETMTQIAQRIDDENRALMKKNGELKIEYLSQENDRDLLLRQLIQQKKEGQKLRQQHERAREQALAAGLSHTQIDSGIENQDGNVMERAVPNLNFGARSSVRLKGSAIGNLRSSGTGFVQNGQQSAASQSRRNISLMGG